jgi:putative ABC transport system ATP-binding protein
MSLLGDLHAAGNAVLLVTHERRIAERADRILHVRDGRLERVEAPADGSGPGGADAPGVAVDADVAEGAGSESGTGTGDGPTDAAGEGR